MRCDWRSLNNNLLTDRTGAALVDALPGTAELTYIRCAPNPCTLRAVHMPGVCACTDRLGGSRRRSLRDNEGLSEAMKAALKAAAPARCDVGV